MRLNILLIAAVAFSLGSCKKILDRNVNPNTPTQTQANYIFTNAQNTTARIIAGGLHITGGTWTGYYAHSTSFTGGGEEKTYVFTNNNFTFFDGLYDNLTDYQFVINNAEKDGVKHLVGPAKIMQALIFQKAIDIYGNIPYSQAFQGNTGFLTPAYDDAKTIYTSLVAKLTEAIADINAATWPVSEGSDIYFKGDKTKWKQLANTIKLRLLVRQSEVSGFNPTSDIAAITSEGSGFIDATVLCDPGYLKTAGKLNPYYQNYGYNENDGQTGDFRKMNSVIINWLKNSNDIFRLQRIASVRGDNTNLATTPSSNIADYLGIPLGGAGSTYLSANVSAMGRQQIVLGQATRAMIIMSDAESKFLQAEAIQRGWLTGNAQTMYETGITRAFRLAAGTQFGSQASATTSAADAAAAAYYGQAVTNVGWTSSSDKLKAIWVQKWVALCNVDGGEAWAEYRRTNSPTNPNGNCPTSPKSIAVPGSQGEPVRLYYPLREESVNTANVPQGINVYTSRIFWDVN